MTTSRPSARADNLEGKTLITSAIDDDRLAFFKDCDVNLVVDVSPMLFERVVGINTIQAMILAALDTTSEELSDHDLEEIVEELEIKPRLLHPTGEFRNIRRFAFVVHPLSQEYIKKGFPVPKGTPKFIMDQVERAAAHMPPMVYSKMDNIISPTGAEAEGWLISVGGTPKEMLSAQPGIHLPAPAGCGQDGREDGRADHRPGRVHQGGRRRRRHGGAARAHPGHLRQQLLGLGRAVGRRRRDAPHGPGRGAQERQGQGQDHGHRRHPVPSVRSARGCWRWRSTRSTWPARTLSKLEALKESILKETPDAKVVATIDYDQYLGDMDMIVTSTSGAGKKILDITKVKPGCVITDVARPLDLPPEEVAKRPDVLVIESGEIELPSEVHMKNIGLPKNVIYACLAETIVLALEGRFEVFTIGRDTEWQKVKEIYKLGLKHGMKLAAISGVNGVYSDEDIAKVVKLAKEARKTWKPGDIIAAPVGKKASRAGSRKKTGKKKATSKTGSRKKAASKAAAKKPAARKRTTKQAAASKKASSEKTAS